MSEAGAAPVSTLGRPSGYCPEIVERVLDALRGGMLLREVSKEEWAPDQKTLWRWQAQHEDFRLSLAHARKAGADRLVAECLPLMDGVDVDSGNGSARVSKAREQVNLRRWLAGCLDRETYGDAPAVQVSVASNVVVAFERMVGRVQGEG
jgi:hypothetical protein